VVLGGQRKFVKSPLYLVLRRGFFCVLNPCTASAIANLSLNFYPSGIRLEQLLTQISRPTKLIKVMPTSDNCGVRNMPILPGIFSRVRNGHFCSPKHDILSAISRSVGIFLTPQFSEVGITLASFVGLDI
jgi:hypothetical protein